MQTCFCITHSDEKRKEDVNVCIHVVHKPSTTRKYASEWTSVTCPIILTMVTLPYCKENVFFFFYLALYLHSTSYFSKTDIKHELNVINILTTDATSLYNLRCCHRIYGHNNVL